MKIQLIPASPELDAGVAAGEVELTEAFDRAERDADAQRVSGQSEAEQRAELEAQLKEALDKLNTEIAEHTREVLRSGVLQAQLAEANARIKQWEAQARRADVALKDLEDERDEAEAREAALRGALEQFANEDNWEIADLLKRVPAVYTWHAEGNPIAIAQAALGHGERREGGEEGEG